MQVGKKESSCSPAAAEFGGAEWVEKRRRRDKTVRAVRRNLFVYSFLLIPLIQVAIFYFYVNIDALALSFTTPAGEGPFYYFSVFLKSIPSDASVLKEAILNTLLFFSVSTFILLPLGYVVGYFLYKKIAGYKFFRIMFFFPSLISSTVIVSIFKRFIAVDGPLINLYVKLTHSNFYPELLGNSNYAIWTILAYVIWISFGGNFLILEGTMKRIPDDVIDYSHLEGVTPFRELVSIITPMIFPTLSTFILLAFTGVFTASGPILLFTEGDYGTMTISYYIFDLTFNGGSSQYSLASAVGLFFTACTIPIVIVTRLILNRFDSEVDF